VASFQQIPHDVAWSAILLRVSSTSDAGTSDRPDGPLKSSSLGPVFQALPGPSSQSACDLCRFVGVWHHLVWLHSSSEASAWGKVVGHKCTTVQFAKRAPPPPPARRGKRQQPGGNGCAAKSDNPASRAGAADSGGNGFDVTFTHQPQPEQHGEAAGSQHEQQEAAYVVAGAGTVADKRAPARLQVRSFPASAVRALSCSCSELLCLRGPSTAAAAQRRQEVRNPSAAVHGQRTRGGCRRATDQPERCVDVRGLRPCTEHSPGNTTCTGLPFGPCRLTLPDCNVAAAGAAGQRTCAAVPCGGDRLRLLGPHVHDVGLARRPEACPGEACAPR